MVHSKELRVGRRRAAARVADGPSRSRPRPLFRLRAPQEKLGPQCMKWLEDQVASIREAATATLQKIAQVRGPGAGGSAV